MKLLVLLLLLAHVSLADSTFVAKDKVVEMNIIHTTAASFVKFNSITLPLSSKEEIPMWINYIQEYGLSTFFKNEYFRIWYQYRRKL